MFSFCVFHVLPCFFNNFIYQFSFLQEGVDEDLSDEDNSDEEMEEQMASIMISASSSRHRLEFLIGDHILPYNMTVYQAVKQFACHGGTEVSDFTDGDTDSPFGHTSLWVQTHTIWYLHLFSLFFCCLSLYLCLCLCLWARSLSWSQFLHML